MAVNDQDALHFRDRGQWRRWLEKNHSRSTGIWLAVSKKQAAGLHYEEAVEEALCYGWIDSTVRRLDADSYRQWYSPRKPRSNWSKSNKLRVERLTDLGLMTAAGTAAVREAKWNGSWHQLDAVENLEEPPVLRDALAASETARMNYDRLAPSHRKQYLYWINSAKREDTRERRIRETVRRLADNSKQGE